MLLLELKKLVSSALIAVTCLASQCALAWEHEIAIGYGTGKEITEDYRYNGFALSGKFYKFKIDDTLIATLDGTLAHWHSLTPHNDQLTTAAIAMAFRGYFLNPDSRSIRPYLGMSAGPALLSTRHFGMRTQGSNASLQITLEAGVEVKNIDLNLHLAHYCNAGLSKPNQGFNIPFVFSIGYLF